MEFVHSYESYWIFKKTPLLIPEGYHCKTGISIIIIAVYNIFLGTMDDMVAC